MIKKAIFIIMLIAGLILTSCATTYMLIPDPNEPLVGEVIYVSGREVVIVRDESSGVAVLGERTGGMLTLHVSYYNNTDINLLANPEAVEVIGIDIYGDREQLKVYRSTEYLRKVRKRQNLALFLKAFGGAMEAQSASTSRTTTYGRVSGNTDDGTSYSGTYRSSSTTVDRSKQLEIQQRNREEITNQAQQFKQSNAALEQGLLAKTTLFPGYYVEGDIMVDSGYASRYLIKIPFGPNNWQFTFVHKRY